MTELKVNLPGIALKGSSNQNYSASSVTSNNFTYVIDVLAQSGK